MKFSAVLEGTCCTISQSSGFVQNQCACWRECAFSTLLLEEPVPKNTLAFQISFGEALALGALRIKLDLL